MPVLHVRLRCGSLSFTTPVSLLSNEFDVRSVLLGQVSLASANQICVVHEAMNGCKNLKIHLGLLWKCKYKKMITMPQWYMILNSHEHHSGTFINNRHARIQRGWTGDRTYHAGKLHSYPANIQCWTVICPPAKRHLNGVSLSSRWWPKLSCKLHFLWNKKERYQSLQNFLDPRMSKTIVCLRTAVFRSCILKCLFLGGGVGGGGVISILLSSFK